MADNGANVALSTYSTAAAKGWRTEEVPAFIFGASGQQLPITHRVKGGVDVTYAKGTPHERTVHGVPTFLSDRISNSVAGFLLPQNALKPVGAYVDPHLCALRYKPFYGVNGSTDPTMCNLLIEYRHLVHTAGINDGTAAPVVAVLTHSA